MLLSLFLQQGFPDGSKKHNRGKRSSLFWLNGGEKSFMALVPGGEAFLSVDEERVCLDLQIVLQASLVHQQVLKKQVWNRFRTSLETV
jgi:hypothetical protein